jgi:signal transduction histidine kinase
MFAASTLLVAIVAAVLLADQVIGAPQRDLQLLAVFLSISGALSLGVGTLLIRLVGRRIRRLRLRLVLASALGLLVALVNVLVTAVLMFLNGHDLALLLLLLGFAAVVSVAFAFGIAGAITADVQALTRAAARLARGDLEARVRASGADEIASLAATFDHMADQLQRAFEQQHALESSRRELVTAVSHDLRTPLATTRALVEALADGVVTEPPEVERYLGLIRREIHHLSRLINDLFELSQIESGALSLQLVPTDASGLLTAALQAHEAVAAARGVVLADGLDSEVQGLCIEVDPDRLQRVLRNLLDNALRYTPSGGVVRLESRVLDRRELEVCVADSGPGISASERERIFERFYRVERSRQRPAVVGEGAPSTGAGLGLAIARAVVQAHGGRMWADASPLGGAALRFSIPIARASAAASALPAGSPPVVG